MSQYQPGSCNIGKQEIRRRQFIAVIGLVATVMAVISFVGAKASPATRLSVFLPAMIFAIGWIQSRKKFCLAYGLMGTFNLGKLGDLSKVAAKEDRERDRTTAISILTQAVVLAGAITGLVVFIPIK